MDVQGFVKRFEIEVHALHQQTDCDFDFGVLPCVTFVDDANGCHVVMNVAYLQSLLHVRLANCPVSMCNTETRLDCMRLMSTFQPLTDSGAH